MFGSEWQILIEDFNFIGLIEVLLVAGEHVEEFRQPSVNFDVDLLTITLVYPFFNGLLSDTVPEKLRLLEPLLEEIFFAVDESSERVFFTRDCDALRLSTVKLIFVLRGSYTDLLANRLKHTKLVDFSLLYILLQ